MQVMKKRADNPPYYCHYMSWRLGTWRDESPFQRLDELLSCAEGIPNWQQEKRPWIGSADFGVFWSLVWQLQVAEHLTNIGTEVCWAKSNQKNPSPDLSAAICDQRWFVECYVPQKSLGLLGFLDDVLQKIDESSRRAVDRPVFSVNLQTSYDRCLPFSLPRSTADRDRFLDEVLRPFLDPTWLAAARREAEIEYPVCLYKHSESSLQIYLDGENIDAYRPGLIRDRTGSLRRYMRCVLKEAVEAKKGSNGLKAHRPNLLAVNYLLSSDFHLARALRGPAVLSQMRPELGPNIDALAVSTVGIDKRLKRDALYVEVEADNRGSDALGKIATRP